MITSPDMLCQDISRPLGQWFATRLNAREDVRKAFMSNIKNKDTLYLVVRRDFKDYEANDIVCAITRTEEFAIELCGRYQQEFLDYKITNYDFYVQGQTFYDE